MYKTVLFDLDGTLLDTIDDLKEAVNYSMRMMHFKEHTREEVCSYVGNGIRNLIKRSVPEGTTDAQLEEAFALFKGYYEAHMNDYTVPYEGIIELLHKLKDNNINVGVVSNKADFAVAKLCDHFFGELVGAAVGEIRGLRLKPASDTLMVALERLGLDSKDIKDVVYVGDSDVDILTATNAGVPCISVAWGFRDEAFLKEHGAKNIVYNSTELYEHIVK